VILEPLWFRIDVSGKDIRTSVFPFLLALVTTNIKPQGRPILLLFRVGRLQFDQRYELTVVTELAADAKKRILFHHEIHQ
jgi:hypothetical protein